jgi:hypothetical protein
MTPPGLEPATFRFVGPKDDKGLSVPTSHSQILHPDRSKGWQVTPFEISILDAEQDVISTTNMYLKMAMWVDSLHSQGQLVKEMCEWFVTKACFTYT